MRTSAHAKGSRRVASKSASSCRQTSEKVASTGIMVASLESTDVTRIEAAPFLKIPREHVFFAIPFLPPREQINLFYPIREDDNMVRKIASALLFLYATAAYSQEVPAPAPVETQPEAEAPKIPEDISSRVYYRDTSGYRMERVLGLIGIYDSEKRVMSDVVDKQLYRCSDEEFAAIEIDQLVGRTAYTFNVDNKFEGSLDFFVGSASISDTERMNVTVSDVSSADMPNPCSYQRQEMAALVSQTPDLRGKTIWYVTGATMSQFVREVFAKQAAEVGISAGSWISGTGGNYKGSGRADSVPVFSLRGYFFEVPEEPIDISVKAIVDGTVAFRRFESAVDFGKAEGGLVAPIAESSSDLIRQ